MSEKEQTAIRIQSEIQNQREASIAERRKQSNLSLTSRGRLLEIVMVEELTHICNSTNCSETTDEDGTGEEGTTNE